MCLRFHPTVKFAPRESPGSRTRCAGSASGPRSLSRALTPTAAEIRTREGAPAFTAGVPQPARLLAQRPPSATSACSKPISTATSTSRAACRRRSPPAWKAASTRAPGRSTGCATAGTSSRIRTPSRAQAQQQRQLPLRADARVLQALARRPAHALHLRVLEGRHAHAGRGAAQQVRPRGAQAAAQAGRGGGRRRQRLRRLHVPRAGALRRQGHRDQHHRLAGRARAARDRAPAPGQPLAADARAISATLARAVRQGGLDRLPRARRPRPARRADPRARAATSRRAASA